MKSVLHSARVLLDAGSNITEKVPFTDDADISSWAKEAVNICRSLGIISGKGNNIFDPASSSTRAECSTLFIRFIKFYLKSVK